MTVVDKFFDYCQQIIKKTHTFILIFFYAVANNNRFQNGKSSQNSKVSTIFHQLLLYLLINVYLLDGVQRRMNIS